MENTPTSTVTKSTFRLEFVLAVNIKASQEKIWEVLTNAADYPKWNSTVLSLEGKVAYHEVIKIRSTLDTNRSFGLTVSEFTPPRTMEWSDGIPLFFRGSRKFELTPRADGSTDLLRNDVFSGLLLPLVGRPFVEYKKIFDKFAVEIKAESEKDYTQTLN